MMQEIENLLLMALKALLSKELAPAELQLVYSIFRDLKGYKNSIPS